MDSTVLQLVANCMDWVRHRRRKAAAKMHLRLDLHSFLPSFAVVDTAAHHDNKRAREVCAGVAAGEVVVFDKAYVDFLHLWELGERGVWWVTRAKDNMKYRAVKNPAKGRENIVKDQIVALQGKHKGLRVRRVEAWVEVDGRWRVMVFIANNLVWSTRSVCDLYRRRWDIEVFFKQARQSLKLPGFLGHGASLGAGARLHAPLRGGALGALGAPRPAGSAQIPWEQHRPASDGLRTSTTKTRNRPCRKNHPEAPSDRAQACASANLWDACVSGIASTAPPRPLRPLDPATGIRHG